MHTPDILAKELRTAIEAAERAGDFLREFFDRGVWQASEKQQDDEGQGLVTEADVKAESMIIETIRNQFPDHHFLGEESARDAIDSENLWVIDPLDGTNNFAHHIPHFAVSIAYCCREETEIGVVYDPIRKDLFQAVRGYGAFHNKRKAAVNAHQDLDETMLAVGFYYDRGEMMRQTLRAVEGLFERNIHGIRRMGTAALDIVQVGLGRFGGYFEYTLSPWDFAAARLFLEEAGGRITTCSGDPLPLEKSSVLATNGRLHDAMLAIVGEQ